MNLKTVLVADDSPTMRAMLVAVLSSVGWTVIEAVDGKQAVFKAQGDTAIDLVITDLNMPILDGLGVIRELRALPKFRFTPILVLTTEVSAEKKSEAKNAGATGWLVKPFDPEQLLGVIQRVVR